jgi:hypothetical protein
MAERFCTCAHAQNVMSNEQKAHGENVILQDNAHPSMDFGAKFLLKRKNWACD